MEKERRQKQCSHERLEGAGTLAHSCPCHRSAEIVQRGVKLGVHIQAMLHCSTLKPESRPHHISFHHIYAVKGLQQKERYLHSENGQWTGVEEGLTQLWFLQQLCSETSGHTAMWCQAPAKGLRSKFRWEAVFLLLANKAFCGERAVKREITWHRPQIMSYSTS